MQLFYSVVVNGAEIAKHSALEDIFVQVFTLDPYYPCKSTHYFRAVLLNVLMPLAQDFVVLARQLTAHIQRYGKFLHYDPRLGTIEVYMTN
jgi:hypothetical protein